MNVVFRVDASVNIGNGHVMRCASLAQSLRSKGAQCNFVCGNLSGNLNAYLESQGFAVLVLNNQQHDRRSNSESLLHNWHADAIATIEAIQDQLIDWLVIDHYGLDRNWEVMLLNHATHLMVIDDLANRPHQCSLLLDANPGRQPFDYVSLTPSGCRLLVGSKYALIRDEIYKSRGNACKKNDTSASVNILIALGGVDKDNFTCKVLDAMNQFNSNEHLQIQVLLGPFAPWVDQVHQVSQGMRWLTSVTQNPSNFVEILCKQDIAVGAGGTSALERCCLGLPSINFVLAPNQLLSAKSLQAQQAAGLVEVDQEWISSFHQQLRQLQDKVKRKAMQNACYLITDGEGADRVTSEIMSG
jgi:UDP-2,4-diacetamido-2,4,6-trideoxy-beta-L-altropyranose hydrolase